MCTSSGGGGGGGDFPKNVHPASPQKEKRRKGEKERGGEGKGSIMYDYNCVVCVCL